MNFVMFLNSIQMFDFFTILLDGIIILSYLLSSTEQNSDGSSEFLKTTDRDVKKNKAIEK